MKKHKRPKLSNAVNSRRQAYKYYYVDDMKRFAVKAGRCYKCGKVNDAFCDKCEKWICDSHLMKTDDLGGCTCRECAGIR